MSNIYDVTKREYRHYTRTKWTNCILRTLSIRFLCGTFTTEYRSTKSATECMIGKERMDSNLDSIIYWIVLYYKTIMLYNCLYSPVNWDI